ncbi:hypothetical protein BRADI_1g55913v3 [Brachypodium distachyon]|uniref:RING-type domain-containing protein n=1 Tax=Brachypodium distachyon TaxID=15368 RepID=A0A2K2DRM9_BRADI|nr:hypothetical protein BRADI_1g55913v3 [Brachypodium distachyon]
MAVTSDSAAAAATMLAGVTAVVGIFLVCFHLSSRSYRRSASADRSGGGASRSAVWEVVEEPPTIIFEGPLSGDDEKGLDEASIAALPQRTELAVGVTARVLPWCGHVFHVECVDTWLRSHATCPLCRRSVADDTVVVVLPPEPEESPGAQPARIAAFFRWLLRRRQAARATPQADDLHRDIEMATGSNGNGQRSHSQVLNHADRRVLRRPI